MVYPVSVSTLPLTMCANQPANFLGRQQQARSRQPASCNGLRDEHQLFLKIYCNGSSPYSCCRVLPHRSFVLEYVVRFRSMVECRTLLVPHPNLCLKMLICTTTPSSLTTFPYQLDKHHLYSASVGYSPARIAFERAVYPAAISK